MYQPPADDDRAGCLDTLLLTRAALGMLLPLVLVMVALLVLVVLAFYLFAVHPALALLPVAALVVGVLAYARWERDKFRPPGV